MFDCLGQNGARTSLTAGRRKGIVLALCALIYNKCVYRGKIAEAKLNAAGPLQYETSPLLMRAAPKLRIPKKSSPAVANTH